VRHLRSMGLCLIAVFAVSAIAAVPALATASFHPSDFRIFRDCPIKGGRGPEHPATSCIWGHSNAESYFKAGNVLVHMVHPVTLQGGLVEEEPEGVYELWFLLPENGTSILTKVPQPAPSLTELPLNTALMSEAEKTRYEKEIAEGKTKVTATIETAGVFNGLNILNEGNLLEQTGTALKFEVQVKLSNAFLGNTCTVGSNFNPINIELTTGPSGALHGKVGSLSFKDEGIMLTIENNELVNGTYTVPGVAGCGRFGGADAALNAALGLPAAAGQNETVIAGTLAQSGIEGMLAHGVGN
jgi:hypothetical protein